MGANIAGDTATGHEHTPFRHRGGAISFLDVSAGEVALPIEVVVDDAVRGGEFLQRLHATETEHRPFTPSEPVGMSFRSGC